MSRRTLLATSLMVVLGLALTGCASWEDSDPEIYNPRADGKQLLAEALRVAKAEQKRVLLNLGANWCSDSQAMFQLLSTNVQIRSFIQANYVFEMVDVNKKGLGARNAKLVERLGNPIAKGIPVLLILDADGQVLNPDPDERLADSAHEHPALVLAYLQKWAKAK
jgi:thiol:disulfide interchange protein